MTDTDIDGEATPVDTFRTGKLRARARRAHCLRPDPSRSAIPADLSGWYLRNGPTAPTADTGSPGTAWCTACASKAAAAWYRNRWVRTDSFDEPFGVTTPTARATCAPRVANTHIVNTRQDPGARGISLPYEITNDLDTIGAYDFGGKLSTR